MNARIESQKYIKIRRKVLVRAKDRVKADRPGKMLYNVVNNLSVRKYD